MGSWLLWRARDHAPAVVGIFLVFGVYYAVLLYHLQYASLVIQRLFGVI